MSVEPIATRAYAPPSISPLTSCWANIVRDDITWIDRPRPRVLPSPNCDGSPHEDPYLPHRYAASRMDRVRGGLLPRRAPRSRGYVGRLSRPDEGVDGRLQGPAARPAVSGRYAGDRQRVRVGQRVQRR